MTLSDTYRRGLIRSGWVPVVNELDRLAEENQQLREALRRIADNAEAPMAFIAHAALAAQPGERETP